MTDRELLENAAKAAGYDSTIDMYGFDDFGNPLLDRNEPPTIWNPLTDDGDALRLAVKLNLDVHFWPEHPEAWVEAMAQDELLGSDPYAATRRAIVRAAAAIGAAK